MNHFVEKVLFALALGPGTFRMLLQSNPAEARAVGRDLGLSAAALASADRGGRKAMRLQERMLAAFGILRQDLPARELTLLRDVEVTCSNCAARRRCKRELDRRTAAANAGEFCPNAATLQAWAVEYGVPGSSAR